MAYDRGAMWWGPAPHKETPSYRPWVFVNSDDHPFSDVECIAAAMTTQRHPDGIEVPDGAWIEGGSDVRPYVSPWYLATFKHASFDRKQGRLSARFVNDVAGSVRQYVPASR